MACFWMWEWANKISTCYKLYYARIYTEAASFYKESSTGTFSRDKQKTFLLGGPKSIFHFLFFIIERNASFQELFTEWKNIVPCQSYRIFKS